MTADPRQSAAEPAPLVTASTSGQGTPAESPAIGLALSGGGVRAALFSLGVVIGLIETGYHQRLRCVTSVSGGSIVNAALAHGPSLTSVASLKDFEPSASAIAANLARSGVFAFDAGTVAATARYLAQVIARTIPTLLGAAFALSAAFSSMFEGKNITIDLQSLKLSQVPWLWVGVLAVVSLAAVIVFSRGLFQQMKYDSVLNAIGSVVGSNSSRLYVKNWVDPSATDRDHVMHVLVATDLLSGEPVFFSKRFMYCKPYGWSDPRGLLTAEALYSSAAFPAVFPPKKLKLSRFRFTGGTMPGELPKRLRLADGGVYNNLGNDWFGILENQEEHGTKKVLWPFGTLDVQRPAITQDNVIIVNAGAPSQQLETIWPGFTVARIMSVLYDNTVRPRLDLLRGEQRAVIDISESPLRLALRLSETKGALGARAAAVAEKLKGMDDRFWEDLTSDTSGTATKLTPAGPRTGARLMLHGYLSSLVLLNARFEVPLPARLLADDYFLSLVSPASSPARAEAVAPAVQGGAVPDLKGADVTQKHS